MTFDAYDVWWWPFVFILLAGWLPTGMWRYLGVLFAGNQNENSEVLVFVRALATALVASVIAKMVLYPEGALATTPILLRLISVATGFAAYWYGKRKVILGVVVAEAILIGWMSAVSS